MFAFGSGAPAEPAMFDAIPKRQSTRGDYDGRPVSAADLQALVAAAAVPGVDLVLITDRPQIDRVRDLVVAGNSAQIADPAFVRELKAWLRFNPRQAMQTGDGLFSATTGNPVLPAWLGSIMFDLVFKAKAENEKYAGQLASTPGVAVFVAQKDDREHWVLAGRACQRFALQATALGLKHAFINQPVEVASLRPELATPGRPAGAASRHRHALRLRAGTSILGAQAGRSRAGVNWLRRHPLLGCFGLGVAAAVLLIWWRFDTDIRRAQGRVDHGSVLVETPCGPIEYQEAGAGVPLLAVHGSGGGYDQGMAFAAPLARQGIRVIAMSRFGYLRTPMPADSSAESAGRRSCLPAGRFGHQTSRSLGRVRWRAVRRCRWLSVIPIG